MNNLDDNLKQLGLDFVLPYANTIAPIASQMGLRPYLVGGIVRDALLNRKSKDIDICVAGDFDKLKNTANYIYDNLSEQTKTKYTKTIMNEGYPNLRFFLQNAGGGVLLAFMLYIQGVTDIAPVIYPRFLTAMTKINGRDLEFVATRTEDYSEKEGDGSRSRNPGQVNIAQEKEDAYRRDFTINALYVNLIDGKLLDLTGLGLNDIKNKIIRTTQPDDPYTIFKDDPLRILRALRQATQLNFNIDSKTWGAIKNILNDNGGEILSGVSMERMRDEISKILTSKDVIRGLNLLSYSGVMNIVLPEVQAMKEEPIGHKDLWQHTMAVLQNVKIGPEMQEVIQETAVKTGEDVDELYQRTLLRLRLSALLHDIGKMGTREYQGINCPHCNKQLKINKISPDMKCPFCNEHIYNDIYEIAKNRRYKVTFKHHEYVGEKIAKKILSRLKFDNQMREWVSRDCALHQVWEEDYVDNDTTEMETLEVGRRLMLSKEQPIEKLINRLADLQHPDDPWGDLNIAARLQGLIQSDSSANAKAQKERVERLLQRYEEVSKKRKDEIEWIKSNKPLLTGDQIMERFKIKPGPWIGEIHKNLQADRLNNPELHNEQRAWEIAERTLQKWGPEIYR